MVLGGWLPGRVRRSHVIFQGSSMVEHSAVNRSAEGSSPSLGAKKVCRSGGTGRRTGLKILRNLYFRTGSIPVFGTILYARQWQSHLRKWQYNGSLVKRLRHRPFTAVTGVRFPYESPCGCSSMVEFRPSKPAVRVRSPSPAPFLLSRDHSSAGRAPALQAGGHRFEPCWSHHLNKNAAW